ncbi:DUF2637 domain-containing protein [Streptomyces sp. C10-9-1]|uniref:DUF2637 domain-containing protein n=1 Tax=Streptomyces sp. C10-9-1 TaxID=1859285 RepID=UPI00211119EF|nr:DUF2637 domain-containing protein [Streptomyces sp. C10-9-1]MCQ6556577.1 DUF2637 domain-containing protein [Streptomyces sp. C10-9-1]
MAAMQLTRTHRILIGVVVAGALVIAAIGFAGSYAAVRELAERKGFGDFSLVFPIGIDAGICVLLALDLLLTWMRIPFPLLRQTAWLLTAATIAFNGAAAWPDPLGVGMHAVIPVLFVVAVEAARHAVGRIADITADKHMEGVRLTRWLLSPVPTFKLWRRMKLWELRSYEQVIKLEQDRLIYQARLQARFGRAWRRKAPVESLMPLRLARYGVPLAETAPAGLAAAGIEPVLLPPAPETEGGGAGELASGGQRTARELPSGEGPDGTRRDAPQRAGDGAPASGSAARSDPQDMPEPGPGSHESPWFAAQHASPEVYEGAYRGGYDPGHTGGTGTIPVPAGPGGRTRPLGNGPQDPQAQDPYAQDPYARAPHAQGPNAQGPYAQDPYAARPYGEATGGPETAQVYAQQRHPRQHEEQERYVAEAPEPQAAQARQHLPEQPGPPAAADRPEPGPAPEQGEAAGPADDAAEQEFAEAAYPVFVAYVDEHQDYPKLDLFDILLADRHGVRHPRSAALLKRLLPEFRRRLQAKLEAEHIA